MTGYTPIQNPPVKVTLRSGDIAETVALGNVTIGGESIRAVPIKDRIGLQGSVTTHYMSLDGKYLGSVNEDSKVTILPTDAATLENIWKDANLTRPGDVEPLKEQPKDQPK